MSEEKKYGPPYKQWGEYENLEEQKETVREIMKTHSNSMAATLLGTTKGTIAGFRNTHKIPAGYKKHRTELKKKAEEEKRKLLPPTAVDLRPKAPPQGSKNNGPTTLPQKLAASEHTQCEFNDCAFEAVPGTRPRRCKNHRGV